MPATINALSTLMITPHLTSAVASAACRVGRLDASVSRSSVTPAWRLRSAWAGYARALQLQGVEIDEIDVLSWGCGLPLTARPKRSTTIDEFEAFALWWSDLHRPVTSNWRDQIPFTPAQASDEASWPGLLRAVEIMRQGARQDRTVAAWLRLPELLKAFGATETPLPCLVDGAKSFRLRATPTDDDWRAVLRGIEKAAENGLQRLQTMETYHRRSMAAVMAERRPGALPRLLTLSTFHPLLSPQSVAGLLHLSLPGAGKLLSRAADLGLLSEVSGRRAWRRYLVPDLAIAFGFLSAPKGRPQKVPVNNPFDRDLASTLATFDEEMRLLDRKLGFLGAEADSPSSRVDPRAT
jgi:hypothetical protein